MSRLHADGVNEVCGGPPHPGGAQTPLDPAPISTPASCVTPRLSLVPFHLLSAELRGVCRAADQLSPQPQTRKAFRRGFWGALRPSSSCLTLTLVPQIWATLAALTLMPAPQLLQLAELCAVVGACLLTKSPGIAGLT